VPADSATRFAEMEEDSLLDVMMEILSMETVAAAPAKSKKTSTALEDPQQEETPAPKNSPQRSYFHPVDSPTPTESLSPTLESTTYPPL